MFSREGTKKMKINKLLKAFIICMVMLCQVSLLCAENIDPHEDGSQYVYGENVGWLNFEPNVPGDPCEYGITVSSAGLRGFIWAENIGWINLSPSTYGGVINDGLGNLSGYAWGENVGWINFNPVVPRDPTDYGVKIDSDGNFDGWAWGENIGWINFDSTKAYNVRVCTVTFEDLANFVSWWLDDADPPANLDGQDMVDFFDFSIFASYWLDYCPDNWPLK